MAPRDLYAILGVKKNASPQEIKKAYRKIARKTHPDVKPGDEAAERRFKEATAAFEVLSDEKKKKLYDEFGEDALRTGFDPKQARAYKQWRTQGGPKGFEGFGGFDLGDLGARGAEGFDIGEILGDLFGGAGGRRHTRGRDPFGGFGAAERVRRRGGDTEARMTISLREAVLGGSREITVDKPRTCSACNGTGMLGQAPCASCRGTGSLTEKARLKVRIPPGSGDGRKIRLTGQGRPGTGGGPPGDLYVTINVAPHPHIRREDHDLYMELPITVSEAMYGATVEVPTFQGTVKVKIPPGSQSGRKLRLKDRGVPRRKGEPGNLYLSLEVRLPVEARDAQEVRDAVKDLEERYSGDLRSELLRRL